MKETGIKSSVSGFDTLGIQNPAEIFWNLSPAELTEHALRNGEGVLADTGALAIDTGAFTGRSPQDKFFVKDAATADHIWWGGDMNHSVEASVFDGLETKIKASLAGKRLYVRDVYACADPEHRIAIRVVTTKAFMNMFVHNMFIRPTAEELKNFKPEYTIINNPEFEANPAVDGTRAKNFAIINMTKKAIIIGGTGYTGEIKKGVFTILNFLLPLKGVMPMHCSANEGVDGDTAVFFGLSGTGKTTLSADPNRMLIGDDEHGWTNKGIFNFEGGCYAKTINITQENEPQIWDAIKFGAVLENIRFHEGTRTADYFNGSVTENTRVSYPLYNVANAKEPSVGGQPRNIFFLTADANGVLPPVSKLTPGQAMFHFISGYTAKVAGTEVGITEPKLTFSTCFGAPFMPLHPTKYAELLGKKMKENNVNVWLINTGWTGGAYGVGSRMKLKYTRAMITAALEGKLDNVATKPHPVFGVLIPESCPNVPTEVLDPRGTWADKDAYDAAANKLANAFLKNFEKFSELANNEIMAGAPKPQEEGVMK